MAEENTPTGLDWMSQPEHIARIRERFQIDGRTSRESSPDGTISTPASPTPISSQHPNDTIVIDSSIDEPEVDSSIDEEQPGVHLCAEFLGQPKDPFAGACIFSEVETSTDSEDDVNDSDGELPDPENLPEPDSSNDSGSTHYSAGNSLPSTDSGAGESPISSLSSANLSEFHPDSGMIRSFEQAW